MVGVVALVRQAIASVQPTSPVAWLCSTSFYEAFANEGVDVSSEFGRALVSMSVNRMGGIPVVKSELIEDGCAFLMGAKGEVLKQVRLPFKCLFCHGHLPDLADCPACLGTGTFTADERSAFLHGTAIQKSWEEWKLELTAMRRIPPVTFSYGSDTDNVDHTCAAWVLSGRVMREEEAHKFVDRRLQDLL